MKYNIIPELEQFHLPETSDFVVDQKKILHLNKKYRKLNTELTIKEAASWETASRLVLTD